ncbi:hypothetical protein RHECIAT_PC0000753 (plasmid) [Rhizobium etli CIAT 652]|uniref:Uncharacterized protein n=1 Tax=Rhizobium etli (strain CIAT 652) TaxID=491916 RepID=B3Q423_RHIE6|nr:hypothetical protein RHECIAT_PC0000753 [Rhizobium etli CIAT 652]
MMKSRHNLLNVERQPDLTRVLENREAYLVCLRIIGSRRHIHIHRKRKIRQPLFWSTNGSLLPFVG